MYMLTGSIGCDHPECFCDVPGSPGLGQRVTDGIVHRYPRVDGESCELRDCAVPTPSRAPANTARSRRVLRPRIKCEFSLWLALLRTLTNTHTRILFSTHIRIRVHVEDTTELQHHHVASRGVPRVRDRRVRDRPRLVCIPRRGHSQHF